jgi:hypothetical protein
VNTQSQNQSVSTQKSSSLSTMVSAAANAAAASVGSGIFYDPIPFSPGLGTDSFGHLILLSPDDTTGVADLGLNAQDYFGRQQSVGIEAHSIAAEDTGSPYPGYLDRIYTIMMNYETNRTVATTTTTSHAMKSRGGSDGRSSSSSSDILDLYPVRATGYSAGSLCTKDKECQSQHCGRDTLFSFPRCIGVPCQSDKDCGLTHRCVGDSGICAPPLGSCQVCKEDSDCLSQQCVRNHCAGTTIVGKMDNACLCLMNSDCASGRCEGLFSPVCEAQVRIYDACMGESSRGLCVCVDGFYTSIHVRVDCVSTLHTCSPLHKSHFMFWILP